jgi:hypothetical protein
VEISENSQNHLKAIVGGRQVAGLTGFAGVRDMACVAVSAKGLDAVMARIMMARIAATSE